MNDDAEVMLKFLDGCRARGVLAVEVTFPTSGASLKANLSPLGANELPADGEARAKLLADPKTPQEVKERIAKEDEDDLFASA